MSSLIPPGRIPDRPTPRTPRGFAKEQRSVIGDAVLRKLIDDADAAVTENKMHNIASLYWRAGSLADGDPGLAHLLGSQLQQYAARRA